MVDPNTNILVKVSIFLALSGLSSKYTAIYLVAVTPKLITLKIVSVAIVLRRIPTTPYSSTVTNRATITIEKSIIPFDKMVPRNIQVTPLDIFEVAEFPEKFFLSLLNIMTKQFKILPQNFSFQEWCDIVLRFLTSL